MMWPKPARLILVLGATVAENVRPAITRWVNVVPAGSRWKPVPSWLVALTERTAVALIRPESRFAVCTVDDVRDFTGEVDVSAVEVTVPLTSTGARLIPAVKLVRLSPDVVVHPR